MKVIVLRDHKNLGKKFDIVEVKDGYARNYLIPNGIARIATEGQIKEIEQLKRLHNEKITRNKEMAQSLAQKLEGLALKASLKIGSKGKSFGSITAAEVAELLAAQGIKISKKLLSYDWPIKEPGVYTIGVKLHSQVSGQFKLWVGEE
ncbi:MAG: 50S ribosomal protein L9 [candidate division WOR-3 bacterium]